MIYLHQIFQNVSLDILVVRRDNLRAVCPVHLVAVVLLWIMGRRNHDAGKTL